MPELREWGLDEVQQLGRELMRSLYRARDVASGETVHLQVVDLAAASPQAADRFCQEMTTLGGLEPHPGLLRLRRMLRPDEGSLLLVTDPWDGTVADLLAESGCLPVEDCLELGIILAGGLAQAHAAGLVHQDVRPAWALRHRAGREGAALGGFGLSRLVASAQATLSGWESISSHVAPELLAGEPASSATDVYGLASTLYQLVTGISAFKSSGDASPAALLDRVLHQEVPPLLGPGIPAGLSEALTEAMAKDPRGRTSEALAFGQRLQEVQRSRGGAVTPLDNTLRATGSASIPLVLDHEDNGEEDRTLVPDASLSDLNGGAIAAAATPPSPVTFADLPTAHAGPPAGALTCERGHRIVRGEHLQQFCRYCGSPLTGRCPNGHEVAPTSTYCGECGLPTSTPPVRDAPESGSVR